MINLRQLFANVFARIWHPRRVLICCHCSYPFFMNINDLCYKTNVACWVSGKGWLIFICMSLCLWIRSEKSVGTRMDCSQMHTVKGWAKGRGAEVGGEGRRGAEIGNGSVMVSELGSSPGGSWALGPGGCVSVWTGAPDHLAFSCDSWNLFRDSWNQLQCGLLLLTASRTFRQSYGNMFVLLWSPS